MPDLDDDDRRRRLRLLMAWGGPEADYLELADWFAIGAGRKYEFRARKFRCAR